MNELSVVKFHNAAPVGKFAVNFNGSMKYWSESFKGGTKANISGSVVQAAKNTSASLRFASTLGKFASYGGSYLGYYSAVENLFNDDYYGALREGLVNRYSIHLSNTRGNIWGIGITIGWSILGPRVTNSEAYNRFFFGRNSTIYQDLERKNNWYESKIFKD